MTDDVPTLVRPAFFDGQALTAADLAAVQAYSRDLLWLHQRTLHGSGIASGLAVTGSKGSKSVTVAPGYAVDSAGRSIVLDAPRELDVPSVVSGPSGAPVVYHLTVNYVPDAELAPTVRAGVCGSYGAVRRPDQPALAWREPRDTADSIVLGAISVLNCALTGPVDLSPRRSALPERQPYVFAGQTQAAAMMWSLWRVGDATAGPVAGLKVEVNTTEAGFANTPRYQASVVGAREFRRPDSDGVVGVVDGYVQVVSPTADGFELRMTLPPGDDRVNPDWALAVGQLAKLPARNRWYVSWLGVES